jgi:FkbM family methyltransferase
MSKLSQFLFEARGRSLATSARIACNKGLYLLMRAAGKTSSNGTLCADWHWFRYPFSLRNSVIWSSALQAWFCPEDESAIECMLHMPRYEPVGWVTPQNGENFLDIGGYVGWYSIQAARTVAPSGQVFSLEPDSANRRQLSRNLNLNKLTNVKVIPLAIWSETRVIGWEHAEEPVWHRIRDSETGDRQEAISIDDLIGDLAPQRLDWIKMDIEGAEIQALEGATRTIGKYRPQLFIEIHETAQQVKVLLSQLGYQIERECYDRAPDLHGWILARCTR